MDQRFARQLGAVGEPAPPPLDFLEQGAKYYRMETRWPKSPFWVRRQPIDLSNLRVFLGQKSMLISGGSADSAPIEALLPPRSLRDLLNRVKKPVVAHGALSLLRESSRNIGDRRILAAVQLMILNGSIRIVSKAA